MSRVVAMTRSSSGIGYETSFFLGRNNLQWKRKVSRQ